MRTRRSQASDDPVPATGKTVEHQSVLLHEVLEWIAPEKGQVIVDATLGGAGHAHAIAGHLGKSGTLIGFDADSAAIERAKKRLARMPPAIHLVHRNFRHLGNELAQRGVEQADAILFDLGWSSFQLEAGRGFSFQADEPLLMTYASEQSEEELTAEEIVNHWKEESLADVIYGWGGERYARRIAKQIVKARIGRPITTAKQLAEIVENAVPALYRRGRTHPATKTFQALRIAVNDELGVLEAVLPDALGLLKPGGRMLVISFHSLEDRVVKQCFRAWQKEGKGMVITKRPITPLAEELAANPRARSAKLRVFEKFRTYENG